MDELRKCPFCGGEAEVISAGRGKYQAQARCTQCHCELGAWYISKQAAAHAWNTRAEKKPTDAVREFAERYERRIAELEEQIAERTCRNLAEPDEMSDRPFTCSECGARGPYGEGTYHIGGSEKKEDGSVAFWDAWPVYKFCPNCGRRVIA